MIAEVEREILAVPSVEPEPTDLQLREAADAQLRVIADETGLDFESLAVEYHKVDLIELAMTKFPILLDLVPVHHFSNGLYAREQAIPAGTMITGVSHREEHFSVISNGSMDVWTPFEGMKRVKAPFMFRAQPGTRRVALIYEDLVWTCFHATDETDLENLQKELYFEYTNPLLGYKGLERWRELSLPRQ